jgi:hypothetical protein
VLSKSRIFNFLKRDCGTIPVAEITSGKIEIFSNYYYYYYFNNNNNNNNKTIIVDLTAKF